MNRLAGTRAYLCGAMDRVRDGGEGWRRDIQRELNDLNIHWLDPTRKPIDIGREDAESRRRRRAAKEAGDWDTVVKEMNPIRRVDLRMVDICDFVIVNLDLDVHATGTYEEVFLANRQKKPILIHVEQGKNKAPDWLFGVLPSQHIFGTWDELVGYLRHVSHGDELRCYGRWFFFNWTGSEE